MNSLVWTGLAVAVTLAGCASPTPRSTLQSRGTTPALDRARDVSILMTNMAPATAKRVFDAPYNTVWRAALDATQQGDLEIVTADRARGYISVRSSARVDTPGEHFGVSVRSLGPSGTEVEVVNRQPGSAGASFRNWENEIVRAIGAHLTESPAVGGTGTQVYIQNHVDGETTVIPEARERRPDRLRDAERRVTDLRQRQREREAALGPEQDADRREELRAEIERLREELRAQEERLKGIEKDRR